MKGFETGILIRSKGKEMTEFGCEKVGEAESEMVINILKTVE